MMMLFHKKLLLLKKQLILMTLTVTVVAVVVVITGLASGRSLPTLTALTAGRIGHFSINRRSMSHFLTASSCCVADRRRGLTGVC